jgi:hypothetical protein
VYTENFYSKHQCSSKCEFFILNDENLELSITKNPEFHEGHCKMNNLIEEGSAIITYSYILTPVIKEEIFKKFGKINILFEPHMNVQDEAGNELRLIEKLNAADSMIFQTEKQIKEFDEKLSDEDKTNLKEALDNLKKSHQEQNLETIESDLTNLNQTWQSISEKLYAQSSSETPTDESIEGKVEDTQFEEVK